MNNISLSGTIINAYDMTSGIVLISIKNEDGQFNAFWYKNSLKFDCLIGSYIIVRGKLSYIKIKMSLNQKPKKILAIETRSIEKYDF